jgi:four helix bundle protein
VAWGYEVAKSLKSIDRHAVDQLLRASPSIRLNIAEGNGKGTNADRRRFSEIARDSALECASIQECLEACEVLRACHEITIASCLSFRPPSALRQRLHSPAMRPLPRLEGERKSGAMRKTYFVPCPECCSKRTR